MALSFLLAFFPMLLIAAEDIADDILLANIDTKIRRKARFIPMNISFPGIQRIHDDPPIYLVANFLSDAECEQWRRDSLSLLKRSTMTINEAAEISNSRTSASTFMPKRSWLERRVSELTAWPADSQELPQITRYSKGEQYSPHYDSFDLRNYGANHDHFSYGKVYARNFYTELFSRCHCLWSVDSAFPLFTFLPLHVCSGGQRVAAVLVYLNSPAKGGFTHFVDLGVRVKPVLGTALVFFPSTMGAYVCDPFFIFLTPDYYILLTLCRWVHRRSHKSRG